jgi:hypothetical protein
MKNSVWILAACTFASGAAFAGDGWTCLFDGKTLNGWHVAAKPEDVAKNYWTVREGAITCDSRGRRQHDYVWLLSGQEYADFELKLKIRSFRESTGNSGVQVRSRYDAQAFFLDGPQIDVHPPGPYRTGLIYDETRGVRHWICPVLPNSKLEPAQGAKSWKWVHADEGTGWNDLSIECRGARIRTVVNGIQIADYDGAGVLDDAIHKEHNVGMRGHVGLQLHNRDDLYIQYKDIYIKPAR